MRAINFALAPGCASAILGENHGQIQPFSGMCTNDTLILSAFAARHTLYEMPASS